MKDLRRLPTGDIDLTGGDIHWGESTLEHQRNILLARMGDYRLSPAIGVGLPDLLDDEGYDELRRSISRNLAADGMNVKSVRLAGGKIEIDANY